MEGRMDAPTHRCTDALMEGGREGGREPSMEGAGRLTDPRRAGWVGGGWGGVG